MAVSLRKATDLDPDTTYSVFLREDNDSGIASMMGLVSGRSARVMHTNSIRKDLLEFHPTT